ncbi:MAG: hypothetical protein D6694_07520 [Gammaproteobacteria bacterium]|nr:MAG: hypothetical protein D6694_07520 [Gammaproteobacteria bacterium]
MVRQSEINPPDGLLVWNFARFARDLDTSLFYKSLLRKNGIVVHSLTDPIPFGSYSRLIEIMIDIAGEEKLRQTARDVKRAIRSLVSQGYAPGGGVPPKGYKAVKEVIGKRRDGSPRVVSRWVPDPDLWEDVKLAWKLRSEGASYREITQMTGGRLYTSTSSWSTFFANKAYLGVGKVGDIEFPEHHEAAVDEKTWEKVQHLRRTVRKRGSPYNAKRMYYPSLLSGLAECAHCGSKMSYEGARDWPFYICGYKVRHGSRACVSKRINSRKVDAVILDRILAHVFTPQFVSLLLDEVARTFSDIEALNIEEKRLQNALAGNKRATQNLLRLLESMEYSEPDSSVVMRLRKREVEYQHLTQMLRDVQQRKEQACLAVPHETLHAVIAHWKRQLLQPRKSSDIHALHVALRKLVSRLVLDYTEIDIWYTFQMQPGT